MRRSTFKPKVPETAPNRREGEFRSFAPRPRAPAPGCPELSKALDSIMAMPEAKPAPYRKTPAGKSQAIRDSARDEACTIRLPGCDGGGATTVWCHLPEAVAGRGLSLKGVDLLGAYGCRSCHDIVDRRAPRPARLTEHDVALAFYRALARSVVILKQKGLV